MHWELERKLKTSYVLLGDRKSSEGILTGEKKEEKEDPDSSLKRGRPRIKGVWDKE